MRSRLLVVGVIAAVMVGLVLLAEGIPSARTVVVAEPAADGAAVAPAASQNGSIWFCPAGTAGTPAAASHHIQIANPTPEPVSGSGTVWSAETGQRGSTIPVTVPGSSTVVLTSAELGAGVGSVMIELSTSGAVVSHELSSGGLWDEGPCASQPSRLSYFPEIDTRRGNSAQLTLFNPFVVDAVVDVTIATGDSVRVPRQLSSVVIPGGTTKTIELNQIVERRSSFAALVEARSGRIAGELVQYGAGQTSPEDNTTSPTGLRMQLGVPYLPRHQLFADGLVTAGLTEAYVLANPTDDAVKVSVAVVPFEADPEARPEPFEVDIPAKRTATIQLDQESRVSPDGTHWVRVDVIDGPGVVAERVSNVTATNSLGLSSGMASSVGTPRPARRWIVAGLDPSEGTIDALVVANPSVDRNATVTITTFAGGQSAPAAAAASFEVGAGKGVSVDLAPIVAASPGGAPMGLIVSSDVGVLVDRRSVASSSDDLAFVPAFPVARTLAGPPSLEAHLRGGGS